MTLNMFHGSGYRIPSLVSSGTSTRRALRRIAELLTLEGPDLVALQEADGFRRADGASVVADAAGFKHLAVDALEPNRLRHGSALLSKIPLASVERGAFRAATFDDKGFVVATVRPPQLDGLEIDVLSVHLDPLRERVRRRQIELLRGVLAARLRPLVAMGDLNCNWTGRHRGGGARGFAKALGLAAAPAKIWAPTYRLCGIERCLDWILASPELDVTGYRTVAERVSDHLAVTALVRARRRSQR
jgi:endonuclease/exonuclease/phosphatase family metal-dependent hydrolase